MKTRKNGLMAFMKSLGATDQNVEDIELSK